jgi:hypothetical protein
MAADLEEERLASQHQQPKRHADHSSSCRGSPLDHTCELLLLQPQVPLLLLPLECFAGS